MPLVFIDECYIKPGPHTILRVTAVPASLDVVGDVMLWTKASQVGVYVKRCFDDVGPKHVTSNVGSQNPLLVRGRTDDLESVSNSGGRRRQGGATSAANQLNITVHGRIHN